MSTAATKTRRSACDKLHNARAIATDLASGEDVFARFTGGRDGTLWYYRSLAGTFAERLGRERALVIELAATVARMGGSAPPRNAASGWVND